MEVEKQAQIMRQGIKNERLVEGTKKVHSLQKEIERMWAELENTYNVNQVTEFENELKARKQDLSELYTDTKTQAKIMVNQNKIITEKTAVSDTAKVKANQLLALYRDARIKYKESQLLQREMLAQIKTKHTEILDNEDRQRQLTTLLKERKERGMSPNTCKRIEQ